MALVPPSVFAVSMICVRLFKPLLGSENHDSTISGSKKLANILLIGLTMSSCIPRILFSCSHLLKLQRDEATNLFRSAGEGTFQEHNSGVGEPLADPCCQCTARSASPHHHIVYLEFRPKAICAQWRLCRHPWEQGNGSACQ
jgi:hypothetical protein